ncbi:chemosensory receptor B [Elysia marginata]|uniref:Chemosensory receptor B n=1 Tax=Elysia marginata TaxID=1093978 RepID=A0AAV4JRQ5_9GAST|nr:chemosensory receptor B [Elysia marginata]
MDIVPLTTLNGSVAVINWTDQESFTTPLVSRSTYQAFLVVNGFGLTGGIAVFGIFSNTLNAVVYLKLGLRETTNINFFALSIVDWVVSVCSCLTVMARVADISSSAESITNLGYYVVCLMYPSLGLGAWITALLSAERCACIVMPLKVKTIVTRRRILCLISGMAVYEIVFGVLMVTMVQPPYNIPNPTRVILLLYSYSIPSIMSFGLVLIFTTFIIVRLRKTLKWRNSTSTQSAKTAGVKERKVVLSILWICIMFIQVFKVKGDIIVFGCGDEGDRSGDDDDGNDDEEEEGSHGDGDNYDGEDSSGDGDEMDSSGEGYEGDIDGDGDSGDVDSQWW